VRGREKVFCPTRCLSFVNPASSIFYFAAVSFLSHFLLITCLALNSFPSLGSSVGWSQFRFLELLRSRRFPLCDATSQRNSVGSPLFSARKPALTICVFLNLRVSQLQRFRALPTTSRKVGFAPICVPALCFALNKCACCQGLSETPVLCFFCPRTSFYASIAPHDVYHYLPRFFPGG